MLQTCHQHGTASKEKYQAGEHGLLSRGGSCAVAPMCFPIQTFQKHGSDLGISFL